MSRERRAKQIGLKELEARKLKLERRLDNLKREYVSVLQGIEAVVKNLEETRKVPHAVL